MMRMGREGQDCALAGGARQAKTNDIHPIILVTQPPQRLTEFQKVDTVNECKRMRTPVNHDHFAPEVKYPDKRAAGSGRDNAEIPLKLLSI
jgi:hypothetical protein